MADLLTDLLALISPKAAYERQAWSQGYAALRELGQRSYAAAERMRLTNDWRATGGSADAELSTDLPTLRNRCRQMVRDNTYAAAAVRCLVTDLVGDGITARAVHDNPDTAAAAQEVWDEWAASAVDGRDDFYGVQKLAARGMVEGGEVLVSWFALDGEPDAGLRLLESDYLDWTKNRRLPDGGKIVAGVEFDKAGRRVAYWLYPNHPGDVLGWAGGLVGFSERIEARDVDHLYESLRAGQTRGVPWLHSGLRRLRDVSDVEESVRIKKRVEACLSVFRKPPDAAASSPLGERTAQDGMSSWETLRPGMIIQGQPGEDISVINPSQSGDGGEFLRNQLMAAAAGFGVPYHRMTGDVSQANYSSLRADVVPYYSRLDDVTFNALVPHLCDPAFARQMRLASLKLRKPELARVKAAWTPPPRPWVDPLKDAQAEKIEMRSIPGAFATAMSARGLDWRKAIKLQGEINAAIDASRVALDSDPRRVDGTGALQPPVGYLGSGAPANAA